MDSLDKGADESDLLEDEDSPINYLDGVWLGKCLDDGTGRNVYYLNNDGSRSRRVPRGYIPEVLLNGERRFYYRNTCIRCRRAKQVPIYLTSGPGEIAFSINLCDECHVKTVPGINRLRGNSALILNANVDTPKNCWVDLKHLALSSSRDDDLLHRSHTAKRATLEDSKIERNRQRFVQTRRVAREYGIDEGVHISWGFGELFDEYYGAVNASGHPDGEGMKIYSDGSVYYGGFQNGEHHTEKRGVWNRPSGAAYDGTWQFGQRHGTGIQVYPDGGRYEGQFAKGLEHGQGSKKYADGSTFEGRFRFGRKDGPGVFTDKNGVVEKGHNFFDPNEKYNEKSPPVIEESGSTTESCFDPSSLLVLSIVALAKAMHTNRDKFAPARRLATLLPDHLKSQLATEYLRTMSPPGTKSFLDNGPKYAFSMVTTLVFQDVKLTQADCKALMYFQGCNFKLQTLKMASNNLDLPSIDLICKNLRSNAWPALLNLDLSFNALDISALEQLIEGVKVNPTIRSLRLASCQIKSNGLFSLAKWIAADKRILSLDIAFNFAEAIGAQLLADALESNKTLTSLNIRSNLIGMSGGQCLCDAVRKNKSLKVLCMADNGCGADLLALLSGRLNGTLRDVVESVLVDELELPSRYAEGRYDFFKRRFPDKIA